MLRIAILLCSVSIFAGCAGARQFVHNGLSYASGSDEQGALHERLSDAEWRQYQAESQNVAAAEASSRID